VFAILLAVQRERRMNELKSEFVANVSHELKTPLALVRMFGEMLQSGRVASDEKRKEYLDIIVNESERLSSLIENVLDFARVERGRGSYEFAEGDVGVVVSRATQVLKYRAEREHTRLEVHIESGLPECRIDDRALQLAVVNLIDNAIKYGRPAAENGTDSGRSIVEISAEQHAGNVVIRVQDHGPGIAKTERERIFERFVRGTKTADKDGVPVRGSGIGLALVKHIAESHGGTAHVESEVGKGSTFILTIPVTPEALAQKAMAIDGKSAQDIV